MSKAMKKFKSNFFKEQNDKDVTVCSFKGIYHLKQGGKMLNMSCTQNTE